MPSDRAIPDVRPGGHGPMAHHMARFNNKADKIKDPKSTLKRLLKCIY